MKRLIPVFILFASGCATPIQNGLFARIQKTDDALAQKYGIPLSVVQKARQVVGIPDARTLPTGDRVLPEGWAWKYDLLDAEGNVVDPQAYHWDTVPKVVPKGTSLPSVFDVPTTTDIDIESVLQLLSAAKAAGEVK